MRIHLWEMSYDDKEVRNMYVASSSNGKLLIVLPEKVAQLPQECLLINQETGEKVSHEEIFIRGDTLQVQYRGLKKGSYSLQVNDVLTESGLFLSDTLLVTTSSYAEKGDVLISEYMADPTPAPTNKEYPEYLELYNRRDSIVKLDDCFLEKNTSQYSLSHITIPAHDYVVIALERDSSSFIASSFRSVPSMPSLNNSGFQINLRCSGGKMIDSIVYSPKDYSGDKRVGGWSLERTYLGKACYPLPVWQFSSHASGGTPGQSNSVSMPLEKLPPPELILKTKEDSCFSFSTNRPIDFSPSDWVTLTHNKKPALFHKQRISDTSFQICLQEKPDGFQDHHFFLSGIKDLCLKGFPPSSFLIKAKPSPVQLDKGDIIFSEYMADPTPSPTNKEYPEYLELYNRRDSIVKLDDCFLEKNTSQYSLSHITIPAHDYVVIALERDSSSFIASSFRSVPSMPSLNNSGFQINLRCSGGKMIDSIVYSPKDYSGDKRVGGWSLERTYLGKACYPLPVWQFSSHASGGTPGQSNSVSMPLEKLPPPELILKTREDSCFSFSTNRPIDFSSSDWVTLTHNKKPALFHKQRISDTSFRLCLNKKPANFQIHRFYLSGLKDKCRNAFPVFSFSQQMATPLPRMLIISEIMFAPSTLESEYIEIHNLSEHTLNLSETSIAGKKEDGSISHVRRLSDSTYMLPAQKSIVLHDGEWVGYGVIPEHLLALTSLPPLNNDSGHLVLLGKGNNILDETDYHARWHSLWLKDKGKGVSLERCINDNGGKERDDFGSWYSTSLNNGKRGTPGSFSRLSCLQLFDASYSLSIDIEPEYIELDRSNLPVLFHCQTAKEQLATFYLLNSEGILEKELFRNITLLGKSTLQWNNIEGITAGIYVLHVVIKDEIGIVKTINKALYFR